MLIFNPVGFRHPVKLCPLTTRMSALQGKRILFFFSWQSGSLYDNNFAEKLKRYFENRQMTVQMRYKKKAFDQNDPQERESLRGAADAVIYFGASSCSTSKYAAIFGGKLDSEIGIPTVAVTYKTFVKDCEHANYDNGTRTRCVFTEYPGDVLSQKDVDTVGDQIVQALTQPLTEEESREGNFHFDAPNEFLDIEHPEEFLFEQKLTDGNPVVIPTRERVLAMLKGTSLDSNTVIAQRVWPNCSYATVKTVAIIATMAGLPPKAMPVCCALAKAYSDAPGQALVVSTNSFGFLPILRGAIVKELGLNFKEHAMSSVPGKLNAAIGRFLRLLQIAVGGWRDAENAFGVIGNPMLGCPAIAENPDYTKKEGSTVTLMTGCWSYFGNYMNMSFESLIEMAKHCDYQTGLLCVVSPKRADELIQSFGSLEEAGRHYRENALITLEEFWDKQDWHKVFTKPQLEHGTGKGELQGYSFEYLRYFENSTAYGKDLVCAFPAGGIRFVVSGGSASKMLRAIHGAPVGEVSIDDYK